VLESIREGAEQSGYVVEGFAPTSRAAKQLRDAGIRADTLQRFLATGTFGAPRLRARFCFKVNGEFRFSVLCDLDRSDWGSSPDRFRTHRKMLTQNLRSLEGAGILIRRDLSDLLLHVEYDLEPSIREDTCSLLDELSNWGGHYSRRAIEAHIPPNNGLVEL